MNWWSLLPNALAPVGALLAAMAGASIALFGVWLTQRGTHRRWDLERVERQHAEQRNAVAEVIIIASKWRAALGAEMKIENPVTRGHNHSWIDQHYDFGRALVIAQLIVTQPMLRFSIEDLIELNNKTLKEWYELDELQDELRDEFDLILREALAEIGRAHV